MKKLLFVFFIFQFGHAQSQTFPGPIGEIGDTSFTGFCAEYLDVRFGLTSDTSAIRFIQYVYCMKGEYPPLNVYPWEIYNKTDRIFVNGVDVTDKDTVIVLDGLVQVRTKEGILYDELYYKDGFIQKYVNRDKTVYHKKKIGKGIWEIAEYDYSIFPLKKHIIIYKMNGSLKLNCYEHFVDNRYVHEDTTDPISETMPVK